MIESGLQRAGGCGVNGGLEGCYSEIGGNARGRWISAEMNNGWENVSGKIRSGPVRRERGTVVVVARYP